MSAGSEEGCPSLPCPLLPLRQEQAEAPAVGCSNGPSEETRPRAHQGPCDKQTPPNVGLPGSLTAGSQAS